jgi:hypothetical protein
VYFFVNPRKLTENLTEQQIEILMSQAQLDRAIFLETAREFTMHLADIAYEVVIKENRLARAGDNRFSDKDRSTAMKVMFAHGFTNWNFVDNGWEMKRAENYDI